MQKQTIFSKLLGLFLLTSLLLIGCKTEQKAVSTGTNIYTGKEAKYVFLFIGDGMAMPQINAAEAYLAAQASNKADVKKLRLSQLPSQGLTTTHAATRYITDSAAAGTALATGEKTAVGAISVNTDNTIKLRTIAEKAQAKGKKIGIISSVDIDHATPACFYAHQATRKMYYEIALDLANSGFDFFGGGPWTDPTGKKSKKEGEKINAQDLAIKNGYKIINTKADFNALKQNSGKIISFNPVFTADKAFKYAIDKDVDKITLPEYTKKAIELLDNDKGFFLMVEGGKIDWACHANDGAAAIQDVIAFDDALGAALDFYKEHPNETAIIVTGDHETGGLTLGFAGMQYETAFEKLQYQKISYEEFDKILTDYKSTHTEKNAKFEDLVKVIEENFGLGSKEKGLELTNYEKDQLRNAFRMTMKNEKVRPENEETYLLYGDYEPLSIKITQIFNQKSGLAWTTYSHTGVPVPTFAIGLGQTMFDGYYDNTDIAKKIEALMTL